MRNRYIYTIVVMLACATCMKAQTNIVHRFSASLLQDRVLLDIIIRAGNTCQGIYIERSTDSIQFTEIGNIPGICGSSERDEPYNFIDEQPRADAVNYYRVRFGENGYSAIETVRYIRMGNNGYKVFPNPAQNKVSIQFANELKKEHVLELYNIHGQKLFDISGIKENTITFSVSNLNSGLYFFRLSSDSQKRFSGSFWVL